MFGWPHQELSSKSRKEECSLYWGNATPLAVRPREHARSGYFKDVLNAILPSLNIWRSVSLIQPQCRIIFPWWAFEKRFSSHVIGLSYVVRRNTQPIFAFRITSAFWLVRSAESSIFLDFPSCSSWDRTKLVLHETYFEHAFPFNKITSILHFMKDRPERTRTTRRGEFERSTFSIFIAFIFSLWRSFETVKKNSMDQKCHPKASLVLVPFLLSSKCSATCVIEMHVISVFMRKS